MIIYLSFLCRVDETGRAISDSYEQEIKKTKNKCLFV